jgi:predicted amidohydrolase
MKCTVVSYSLSEDPASLTEWKANLKQEILGLIRNGSKIILYPELFLMGTAQYFLGSELDHVAHFTTGFMEELSQVLQDQDVFLVLGSGPRIFGGQIFNSCPIYFNNRWFFQDKLYLTPWETDFVAGTEMKIFEFHSMKTAVAICFDSEQPDLATLLKSTGIDILLVPSATANENGNNRVNRCSSARSIELGACVVTSPLVGDSKCDLVDHNEGRQGFFLPAQEEITSRQEVFSSYSTSQKVICDYEIDLEQLKRLKLPGLETKPFLKPLHKNLKVISV